MAGGVKDTAEHRRLAAHRARRANWRLWGPYLSERAWGTVREDYSADGTAWDYLPHDHARSRAYRWNEDGIAGLCDRNQYLCLRLALWNGCDPILKERMFGLNGDEGNHAEDVKEYYYYLDGVPTHAYMKMLYKYPQRPFPYADLVENNRRRSFDEPEYDLINTGAFDDDRYFDVEIEYAKAGERDIFVYITAHNRGPDAAPLDLLPTLWFRNTWSWGYDKGPMGDVGVRPHLFAVTGPGGALALQADHVATGSYFLYARAADEFVFSENETNNERLFNLPNASPYVKDAFHRYLVEGRREAVNPAAEGTMAAAVYRLRVPAGASRSIALRLCDGPQQAPFELLDGTLQQRRRETDEFYEAIQNPDLSADELRVQRQALAGMLWNKQLYYYDVQQWLDGDPIHRPPERRRNRRNHAWTHLTNFDVISMPDKWEYPWYASWDTAFHCIPLALIDIDFAKRQLELFTREWYMHPNGQLPAYEWAFDDVNPPLHAWAAWRIYKIEQRSWGRTDRPFLEGVFHKLLLNFTWWINRKDADGSNIFQGGFLGLDNIGVFDRSKELPTGGRIDQSDGTSWMAAYSLQMMQIALELAREESIYQNIATKFFEHFLRVAHAMTAHGRLGDGLWDEADGFFYDMLRLPGGSVRPLRVRSLVGLLPLIAVATLEPDLDQAMPTFARRMHWFLDNRPDLAGHVSSDDRPGQGQRRLLALLTRERLVRVLEHMLDEQQFLSPYGLRSLSRHHADEPFELTVDGHRHVVGYQPAESRGALFGGNSNWRGPIWFPTNYLLIEALQRFHHYYGDDLKVAFPTGSSRMLSLGEVAAELSRRLTRIFLRDASGRRPVYADSDKFQHASHFRDLILFHEYFHGDTGAGLGAQHQTGWTGLVAKLLQQSGGAGG